jgi:lipoprotein signal peptidase
MWKNFFPYVFNVADSFLCTGVTLMILYSLVTEHQTRKIQARQELRPTDG